MTQLERSILQTVVYFDLFDYSLTITELYSYLWKPPTDTTLTQVINVVLHMPQLGYDSGCVYLKDRANLIATRQKRYILSDQKIKKRRPYLWLLSLLPNVEAIFIVNSTSYHNARDNSDIDLLVISRTKHIWSTRFFTTALAKILRLRPHNTITKDTLCLSFYIDEQALDLSDIRLQPEDIHQAFWIIQWLPIYDPKNIASTILQYNTWVQDYIPKAEPLKTHPALNIRYTWLHHFIKKIGQLLNVEHFWKTVQLWIMPDHLKKLSGSDAKSVVVLSNTLLKFHTSDPRPQLMIEWEKRLANYN